MTGHEALMSARFSYVLYHPDHKVREQFEHLLKHSGQNLTVDPYHDNCGNPIAEGHPHYEASLAFIGFSQGERTTMRQLREEGVSDFSEYFEETLFPHLSAGYLSRFGEVAQ